MKLAKYCFAFACSYVAGLSCQALPAQVKVALFDSRTPAARLAILGPCLVASDHSFTIPAGRYLLEADRAGEVCLRSVSGSTAVHPDVDSADVQSDVHSNLHSNLHSSLHSSLLVRARSLRLLAPSSGSLRIEEPRVSSGAQHSFRRYKGSVIVSTSSTAGPSAFVLKFVNAVSRREYLASVVASEMPVEAPLEALKAQSILANTQLAQLSPSQVIEDSTQVQSYRGVPDSPSARLCCSRSNL